MSFPVTDLFNCYLDFMSYLFLLVFTIVRNNSVKKMLYFAMHERQSTHVSYFQRPQDRLEMRLTKKIRDVGNYYRNYITKIKDGPLKAAKGVRSKNKYSRQHNSRASNRDEKSCIKLAT